MSDSESAADTVAPCLQAEPLLCCEVGLLFELRRAVLSAGPALAGAHSIQAAQRHRHAGLCLWTAQLAQILHVEPSMASQETAGAGHTQPVRSQLAPLTCP